MITVSFIVICKDETTARTVNDLMPKSEDIMAMDGVSGIKMVWASEPSRDSSNVL